MRKKWISLALSMVIALGGVQSVAGASLTNNEVAYTEESAASETGLSDMEETPAPLTDPAQGEGAAVPSETGDPSATPAAPSVTPGEAQEAVPEVPVQENSESSEEATAAPGESMQTPEEDSGLLAQDPSGDAQPEAAGWVKKTDGKIQYMKSGEAVKGWLVLDGKSYFFDKDGNMATGKTVVGKYTFYFKASGAADGTKGQMLLGWQKLSGNYYYFKKTGAPGIKGALLKGWQNLANKTFYFRPSSGALSVGFVDIGKNRFYFRKSGQPGTYGAMATGWASFGGRKVYFEEQGGKGVRGKLYRNTWKKVGSDYFYMDKNGFIKKGWQKDKGSWYYLKSNGAMATGWNDIPVKGARYSSLRFYFKPSTAKARNGQMLQDVSSIIGKRNNYYTEVSRTANVVTVYAQDSAGNYRIPVKAMTCSVGRPGTPTPTGVFNTIAKYRWKLLMGPSYGQYATRIVGGVLFHSVAGLTQSTHNVIPGEYNLLGQPASHGCVRLNVRDAKWIYDNCRLGMTVKIGDGLYQPFDKPATIKIPAGQNWDPTDPAA